MQQQASIASVHTEVNPTVGKETRQPVMVSSRLSKPGQRRLSFLLTIVFGGLKDQVTGQLTRNCRLRWKAWIYRRMGIGWSPGKKSNEQGCRFLRHDGDRDNSRLHAARKPSRIGRPACL